MATESLAANKGLASDGGQQVADGGQRKKDSGGDQGGVGVDDAEEEHDGHDGVGTSAGIVGRDLADHGIELGGRRADAEEQGDLDEQNDERKGNCECADDDDKDAEGEDARDAGSKTEDHGQYSKPLSIDAEVSRGEFFLERHGEECRRLLIGRSGEGGSSRLTVQE
jgi:hypothetical protein